MSSWSAPMENLVGILIIAKDNNITNATTTPNRDL